MASWRAAGRYRIGGRTLPMPKTRVGRAVLGAALVVGGVLGFLPILGFWMIPLGLLILSEDFAYVRRLRRRLVIRFQRWQRSKDNGSKDAPRDR